MIKLFTTTAPTDSIDTQDFGLAYFYVNFYNNEYTYINEKLIKVKFDKGVQNETSIFQK